MARKKTEKAKELIKLYAKEISKYPDGKEELNNLFVGDRKPEAIMALPPGPDRSARLAQLVGDLKELARELAENQSLDPGSKKIKKIKKMKKSKPSDIVSKENGKFERFSYTIGMRQDGYFVAKINKKGRNVIEHKSAPSIYDNERLKKLFRSKDEAEFAVRRVINTALVWYGERGITPREKVRISKGSKAGIIRRTSSDLSDIAKSKADEKAIALRKKAAAARRERIRAEKMPNPERKIRHMPRKNPSSPFSFKHSESSAGKQAKKSFELYKKYEEKWRESLRNERPRFSMVMKAYDSLENSRANFVLSGQVDKASKVDEMKVELRQEMVDLVTACSRLLSRSGQAIRNP